MDFAKASAQLLLCGLLIAVSPGASGGAQAKTLDAAANPTFESIRFSVAGTRLASSTYWEVDSSGKGVVSAPAIVGYKPPSPLANDPAYHIGPGEHRIEIGTEGYRALREFLEPVIGLKPDPGSPLIQGMKDCWPADDIGATEISWTGGVVGSLTLPNDCLTAYGKTFKDRMGGSWFVIATAMHLSRHQGVSIVEPGELSKPQILSVTEKGIWNPYTIQWEIDSKGKGWIDFSEKLALRGADPMKGSVPVDAVRYGFQLDPAFHQAILREFAPYMGNTPKSGSCEDEITASDQPVVKIEWENSEGQSSSYQSDLGCPSFASRAERVKTMFAELLRNGNLGGATLLWGK